MIKVISGEVIHGEKLGRVLGFPTANVEYTQNDIDDSVFHINIIIDGKIHRGMGSYMVKKNVFEAHIFAFEDDIYGKTIEIVLLEKIRDNKKFNNLDELKAQISHDRETILKREIKVLTFGSFDLVHKGHEYYLSQAKRHGTTLTTIVAHDSNIESIKGQSPQNTQSLRIEEVQNMHIADTVLAGRLENPLTWIHELQPDIICLGYDQRGPFVDVLETEIKRVGLQTKIMRILPHDPEKYKSSLLKKKRK